MNRMYKSGSMTFSKLMQRYTNYQKDTHQNYMFVIEKECGYQFLVTISKNASLERLYEEVTYRIGNHGHNLLYHAESFAMIQSEHLHPIPRNNTYKVREYVRSNASGFVPLYKNADDPVCYRLLLDDEICHRNRTITKTVHVSDKKNTEFIVVD